MAAWTYPTFDLVTGRRIRDHLPIRCDSFTDGLGLGQWALNGMLPLQPGVDVDDDLEPMRRVIMPTKKGIPHGAYVVTDLSAFGPKGTSVTFVAPRVDVIFSRREVLSSQVFRGVEQFDILRQLIGTPYPWLRIDTAVSGIRRSDGESVDGYQIQHHSKVSDAITTMSALEDGFDYRLDYSRDLAGDLVVTMRLGYPQLGRSVPVLPLEYPGNIVDWTYAVSTADTETYSSVYGSTGGTTPTVVVSAPAVDTEALEQGWPLLMGSESSTASEQATVDGLARARLAAHKGPNFGWTLLLKGDVLGSYDLGDVAQLHIKHRRWKLDKRATVRITGHKIEPARQGRAERITPTVVEV